MKKIMLLSVITILLLVASPQSHSLAMQKKFDEPPPDYSWKCWDDGSVDPCHNSFNILEILNENYGWAFGDNNVAIIWNGNNWEKRAHPLEGNTNYEILAMDLVSENNGWAVGTNGLIYFWNGSTWSVQTSPTTAYLYDVEMISEDEGWITGSWGTILHYENQNWTVLPAEDVPISNSIRSLSIVPGSNGNSIWALSYYGEILHWNGNSWNYDSTIFYTSGYYTIDVLSEDDHWVQAWGKIYHYNGTGWTEISPGSSIANYWDLQAYASNEVYVTYFDNGTSSIRKWNGSEWQFIGGNVGNDYYAIGKVPNTASTQIWFVGEGSFIVYWDGSTLSDENPIDSIHLYDISFSGSQGSGWAVACGFPVSGGQIKYWNGSTWSNQISFCAYTISIIPESNGERFWAGGVFGDLGFWNGVYWQEYTPSPSEVDINSIFMLSENEGWAVGGGWNQSLGDYANIILYWDGNDWSLVTHSDNATILNDVFFENENLGWIVGDDGLIMKWEGAEWTIMNAAASGNEDLNAIYLLGSTTGWIAGDNGLIMELGEEGWQNYGYFSEDLLDISMYSESTGWIVGQTGQILSWNGSNWNEYESSVTTSRLAGIDWSNSKEFWAVGTNGVILHYGEPAPDMNVKGNNLTIPDGDTTPSTSDYTDFGNTVITGDGISRSFIVYNLGNAELNLTGTPKATISGANADDFSITMQPTSPVPVAGSTTFTIHFNPDTIGEKSAIISMANDDADENPYNFSIRGIGVEKQTFGDVPEDHPLYEYMEALYAAGYTAGCSTDPLMFCPDTVMDRGMAAVFMLRGQFGASYVPGDPTGIFGDNWNAGPWAQKWSEAMYNEGLSSGCSSNPLMYCPWTQLNRQEASVFGLRMKHGMTYTPPAASGTLFADMTNTGFWGTKWAEQAYLDGLLPACGWQDGKPMFCPEELVDRGWGAYLVVTAKDLLP